MKARRQELPVDLRGLAATYEVVRELGRGSTSTVYLARDHAGERDVAVKVIRASHLDDIEALARFEREAAILARLHHPHIVRLYATCALEDGRIALIMQFVRGRTLKSCIRDTGPLSAALAETVLRDIASAIEHAAQHAIVHRDIKPENIFIDDDTGRAVLADFGIARLGTTESTLTLTGAALGTPTYMSPEQIDGGALDARSDLYSLGMTAYEMLTGEKPWAGDNLYTVIYRQKREELPALRRARPDLPVHLVDAVNGLIRKHRVARWSSPADFIAKLDEGTVEGDASAPRAAVVAMEDSPTLTFPRHPAPLPTTRPVSVRPPAAAATHSVIMPPRRSRRRAAAIAAALLLVTAASGATMVMIDRQPTLPVPTSIAGPDESPSTEPTAMMPTPEAEDSTAGAMPLPAAQPGARAARVAVVSGGDQRAAAGDVLPEPIVVQALAEDGSPVANARVVFRVVAGDGNVAPPEKLTDSRGRATAAWALGATVGQNQLAVVLGDGPQTVARVNAVGVTGPAAVIAPVESEEPITSETRREVRFRVEDRNGNPVAGARVDMRVSAGGGSIAPAAVTTQAAGIVQTTWNLGRDTTNRLSLRVAGTAVQLEYSPPPFRLAVNATLVAGGTHSCTLDRSGVARCWGGNDQGQLGSGRTSRQAGSVRVLASAPLARIAVGISHSCAIDIEGTAICWGSNTNGQLGTGDRTPHAAPAPVRSTTKLIDVTAGLAHTCALNSARTALCWGSGAQGQIGDGATSDRTSPTPVAGGHVFTSLAAGWQHTCGLTQNVAWCWGSNAQGQLGDETTSTRSAPVRVAGGHRFRSISAGAFHTCGVATDGTVWCWGQNDNGQIGGTAARSSTPVQVTATTSFSSVASGAVHTCALSTSGEVWCWGGNNFGQLGNEGTGGSTAPVRVVSELRFTSLTSSGSHTCGRTSAGDFCWGYNVEGQLGEGTRTNRARPVRVGGAD